MDHRRKGLNRLAWLPLVRSYLVFYPRVSEGCQQLEPVLPLRAFRLKAMLRCVTYSLILKRLVLTNISYFSPLCLAWHNRRGERLSAVLRQGSFRPPSLPFFMMKAVTASTRRHPCHFLKLVLVVVALPFVLGADVERQGREVSSYPAQGEKRKQWLW